MKTHSLWSVGRPPEVLVDYIRVLNCVSRLRHFPFLLRGSRGLVSSHFTSVFSEWSSRKIKGCPTLLRDVRKKRRLKDKVHPEVCIVPSVTTVSVMT